jgi:hypothetical protein
MNALILFLALLSRGVSGTALSAPPATAPATAPAFQILVDTSDVPEMRDYGLKAKQLAEVWYPKIYAMLPSDGFAMPPRVTIIFKKDEKGVAGTAGDHIVCSAKWFTDHPDDIGAIVHEMVHVVQAYHHRTPGWITEGIADYVRFFKYEPASRQPHPTSQKARYDASYRTSAAFLNWVSETHDKDLVKDLNAACREGKYTQEFWTEHTKKTLAELGEEWKKSLN